MSNNSYGTSITIGIVTYVIIYFPNRKQVFINTVGINRPKEKQAEGKYPSMGWYSKRDIERLISNTHGEYKKLYEAALQEFPEGV